MNLVAVGPHAEWLTRSTVEDDPWGPDSPLARVVEADGTVLLLGAPLDTLTLVHHAERIAAAEPKRWVSYEMPIHTDTGTRWHQFRAIDTSRGAYDYEIVTPDTGYIEAVAQSALNAGIGQRAVVFGATCHMFPARPLVQHVTTWIEQCFGGQQSPSPRHEQAHLFREFQYPTSPERNRGSLDRSPAPPRRT